MVYWIAAKVKSLRRRFVSDVVGVADRETVEMALGGFRQRQTRKYGIWPLLRTFLSQVMMGMPCREAVACAIQQGWVPGDTSPSDGAYCNARNALPEQPLRSLALAVGEQLHARRRPCDSVFGRPVKVVDGTSVQLPDTPANQAAYPQSRVQKPGCGLPVMYLVGLMSLGTGALLAVVSGAREGCARALFRRLWCSLQAGDILLGDAGFGSFAEVVMLQRCGVDGVFRMGRQRKLDTRRAMRQGYEDWLVLWRCPALPGAWVDRADLPKELMMRVIRFRCPVRGFRSDEILLATTLLDPVAYPRQALIRLYHRRWDMELRLRDIKTTLGLELLRCHTPSRCRKELWLGLLGYNLIRTVMVDAARRAHTLVSRISFAGAVQRIRQCGYGRWIETDPRSAYRMLLDHLAHDRLPVRPNRVEPRKIKRRPKPYPLLTQPRSHEIAALTGA